MTREAEYMRRWRARPENRTRMHRAQRARYAALLRLARTYARQFEKIHNEERARRGLPPIAARGSVRRAAA